MTRKFMAALAVAIIGLALASPAEARPKHHKQPRHDSAAAQGCVFTNEGRVLCGGAETRAREHRIATDANGNRGTIVGGRPAGCPHAFCGCSASLYLFGRIIPSLNLAANWIRKFPRTHPAPGMVAARKHHVMVLMSHAGGNDWLVHDGNSGGGKTREHVRSIAGYVIVDPREKLALQ